MKNENRNPTKMDSKINIVPRNEFKRLYLFFSQSKDFSRAAAIVILAKGGVSVFFIISDSRCFLFVSSLLVSLVTSDKEKIDKNKIKQNTSKN